MAVANHVVENAVRRGIIDLLVQPEYGDDWVREVLESVVQDKSEVTDELVEHVDDLMTERLRVMASVLVDELTDVVGDEYQDLK